MCVNFSAKEGERNTHATMRHVSLTL